METFLQSKLPKFVPPFKKPNQRKHGVATSGKAITEGDILQKLKEREQGPKRKLSFEEEKENHPGKSSKGGKNGGKGKKVGKGKISHPVMDQPIQRDSQPGPSHIVQAEDIVIYTEEEETCCQCHQWSPPGLKLCTNLTLVNWAQCSSPSCGHWVHLRFCVPLMIVKNEDVFKCPCCTEE